MFAFDAPPADVVAWAVDQRCPVVPIAGEPVVVRGLQLGTGDPAKIEVRRGLYGEWVDPNQSDHRTTIAYDADRGRAYVEQSYR